MSTDTILLQAEAVSMHFGDSITLDRVDLTLRRGQIVTLIGPNGSGKTTLVRILLGLVKPDSGKVRQTRGLHIGYMPQRLSVAPVLPLTVQRFLGMAVPGQKPDPAVLDEVGVAHLLKKPLQNISGGEMQRVLLARALLRKPDLLVLDEPAQGVDATGQIELYRLIARIRDEHGCGVLMVSHDLHLVMAATDQVICLNHHVCCSGHPEAVTRDPAYQALFGSGAADLAIYTHHHDHDHDLGGRVVDCCEDHEHG